MVERLTPYLRHRVLNLPASDRVALAQALQASFRGQPSPDERLRFLAEKMNAAAGVDIRERTNARSVATARWLFAFVARREGFPQKVVAAAVGLDHSSVSYAEKRVREIFAYPETYGKEIELYNKYIESL